MKLNIITSFYIASNEDRNNELIKSLDKNVNNVDVEAVHLYIDNQQCYQYLETKYKDIIGNKIKIIEIGKQPLYSDLFEYANKLRNKLCVIINSDIWFHKIDQNVLNKMKRNDIYALTRHESGMSSPLINKYTGSHDAFIFYSPIKNDLIKHIKHPQNVWGSENVLLYELKKLKYNLFNPCKQIVIVHEHKSNVRNPSRERINRGDKDGDGVFKIRSYSVKPDRL